VRLASGLSAALESFLATASHVYNHHLDASSLGRLVERAGNEQRWALAPYGPRLSTAWFQFGRDLGHPRPEQAWIDADSTDGRVVANRLAQARTLARFTEEHGDDGGFTCLDYVLRRWGQRSAGDEPAEAIGDLEEWPTGLTATRQLWIATKSRVDGLSALFQTWSTTPDGYTRATGVCDELTRTLNQIVADVDRCRQFTAPEAQAAMLNVMQRYRRQVAGARRRAEDFARAPTSPSGGGRSTPPTPSSATTTTTNPPIGLNAPAWVRGPTALRPSPSARRPSETPSGGWRATSAGRGTVSRQPGSHLTTAHGGTLGGLLGWYREDWQAATEQTRALGEHLLRPWIADIVSLRRLLRAAGRLEGDWPISAGPPPVGRGRLAPDIQRIATLHQRASEVASFSLGAWREEVARWRRMANY